jgi:protein TonB
MSPGERLALQRRIRSAIYDKRRYPRLARIRGLEGRVVLEFRIRQGGAVDQARVVRSAGEILDQAALSALREAAPLPYYPDRVTVPIVFTLED